jgi:flagellar biosynthesis protein FliP
MIERSGDYLDAVNGCDRNAPTIVARFWRRNNEGDEFAASLVAGGNRIGSASGLADESGWPQAPSLALRAPSPRGGEGEKRPGRCKERRACDIAMAGALCAVVIFLVVAGTGRAAGTSGAHPVPDDVAASATGALTAPKPTTHNESVGINKPLAQEAEPSGPVHMPALDRGDAMKTVQTVALFGLISLAPMGLLMVTAFVRINIVLILLRQALGSPQVPGNQVLTALALLLTAIVMRPLAEKIYQDAIVPYTSEKIDLKQAWAAGSGPIKGFMVDQIKRTNHEDYLHALYEYAVPESPGEAERPSARAQDFPLRVVAPAYLLSELTTALLIGFYVYLPFLVIDLVVSSVLAATGLFMLPPALVATPIKLIVFVLADGWLLIATMLLSSFAPAVV